MDLNTHELNAEQRDALLEIIGIAFGRAGAALAELTGRRVMLQVPNVTVTKLDGLIEALKEFLASEVTTIQQVFHGSVTGSALLVVDLPGAVALKEILTDEPLLENRIDASVQEMLTEVGNIVLNAMIGTFGNLLKTRITFSIPRLYLDSLEGILKSLIVNEEVEMRYALVVHTVMHVRESKISGYVVMVLGIGTLDRFLHAVQLWAEALVDERNPDFSPGTLE